MAQKKKEKLEVKVYLSEYRAEGRGRNHDRKDEFKSLHIELFQKERKKKIVIEEINRYNRW